MTGASLPPYHVHTVTVQAGDAEREHILTPLEAQALLDHLYVVADAAGGHDNGVGHALDGGAVLPLGLDADDLALVTLDQILDCSVELEVHPQLHAVVGHVLDVDRGAALSGLVSSGHLDDVLGLMGVFEVFVHALELGAHAHQPVDGVGGHVEPAADQLGVGAPVGVLHEVQEGLVLGPVVHILLLQAGLHGEQGHAHVGRAAGGAGLLKSDDLAAPPLVEQLLGLNSGGQAGHTGGNDDNVGFHFNAHSFALL